MNTAKTDRSVLLAFFILFALFILSRSHNILWGDIFSLRGNEFDSYRDTATEFSRITATHLFPLYYRVTQFLVSVFGYSDTVIRIFPYTVTMLSFPVFFFRIRAQYSDTAALSFAVIMLLSPTHLLYSANARAYALAFFFVGMCCLSLADFFATGSLSKKKGALLALWGLLAVISHNSVIFPLGASLLFFAGFSIRNRKLSGPMLTTLAAALAVMAAIAIAILSRHQENFVIDLLRPLKVIVGFIKEAGFASFILCAGYGTLLIAAHRRMDIAYLFGVIIISFLGTMAIGALDPQIANRYLYTVLFSFFLLAALAIDHLAAHFSRETARSLIAVILTGMLVSGHLLEFYDFLRNGDRYDYSKAVSYVESHAAPGDILLSPPLPNVPDVPRLAIYAETMKTLAFKKEIGAMRDETFDDLTEYIDIQQQCRHQGNLWFIVREDAPLCRPGDQTIFCAVTDKVKEIRPKRYDHHSVTLGIYRTDLPECGR